MKNAKLKGKKETLSKSRMRIKNQITDGFDSTKFNMGSHTSKSEIDGNKKSLKQVNGKCECETRCEGNCHKRNIVQGLKERKGECGNIDLIKNVLVILMSQLI